MTCLQGDLFTRSCKLPFDDDRVIWSRERYCLVIMYSLLFIYAALTLVFVCICICICICHGIALTLQSRGSQGVFTTSCTRCLRPRVETLYVNTVKVTFQQKIPTAEIQKSAKVV